MAFCFCLALSACSGISFPAPDATPPAAPTPTQVRQNMITPTATTALPIGTVSIWHSWQDDQLPALLRQIDVFRDEYPGVQFDVTYVPSLDLRAAYEQAAQEGRAPNVVIGPAEWGPSLFDQGLIADLSSLNAQELLDGLNPAAVDAARYKGALLGLPLSLEGVVLYRNRSIIPSSPATFDELVSLAQAATQGLTLGAVLDRGFAYSGAHLAGLGGKWIEPDGSPAFNDEKGQQWVQLLGAFDQVGPTEYQNDTDMQYFKEGRVGFITEGTWQRQNLAEAIGPENLAIDPWPLSTNGSLSGFVRSDNVYLNPEGLEEDQMVTWKFVQSLLTPEAQAGLAEVGLIPAITPSQLTAAGAAARVEDALISQAMLALADGTAYPVLPQMSIYLPYLDIAIQSIFNGEAAPADALQAAQDGILAALQGTPSP